MASKSKRNRTNRRQGKFLDVTDYSENKLLRLVFLSRGLLILIFMILMVTLVETV